ncbi:MAG: histidine phosphatase family protein [Clostridia bacterium]|nr:histidine phosphatase family protein [Clostridia bacterium]
MTKIYLVRHCQAQGNVKRIFQGSSDTDISELGAKQLEGLSRRFEGVKLDRVYSSPKLRALKTAAAIVGTKGLEIYKREDLRELHGGVVEGRSFDEIKEKYPDLWDKWCNHPQDFAPDGGEPMREAYDRIWNEIMALARENKGRTIAAATHGGVLRLLCCRLFFHDIERLNEADYAENTGVTLLEFDNALTPTVTLYNDVSHLKGDCRSSFVMLNPEDKK